MKKEYITPRISTINLALESLLCASKMGVNNDLGTDDDFNTNRRGGWENFWEDSTPLN